MNKINALIQLRINMLIANKSILIVIFMPYFMGLFYSQLVDMEGMSALNYTLVMALSVVLSMMIVTTIAEEKEKKCLKTLLISGVSNVEYVFATVIIPIIISLFNIVILPMLVNADKLLKNSYFDYFIVSCLTMISITLLSLFISTFSKNQTSAQINVVVLFSLCSFIPMISSVNESIESINNYSFMGLFTKFFNNPQKFNLFCEQTYILFIWIFILLILNYISLKNSIIIKNTEINIFKTKKSFE